MTQEEAQSSEWCPRLRLLLEELRQIAPEEQGKYILPLCRLLQKNRFRWVDALKPLLEGIIENRQHLLHIEVSVYLSPSNLLEEGDAPLDFLRQASPKKQSAIVSALFNTYYRNEGRFAQILKPLLGEIDQDAMLYMSSYLLNLWK